MYDIKWIKNNVEVFDKAMAKRGLDSISNKAIELYDKYVVLLSNLQKLQNERNNLSKKTIIDRIKLQMEDSQKIKHADFVIYNNSSTSELFNEIDKIIKNINE